MGRECQSSICCPWSRRVTSPLPLSGASLAAFLSLSDIPVSPAQIYPTRWSQLASTDGRCCTADHHHTQSKTSPGVFWRGPAQRYLLLLRLLVNPVFPFNIVESTTSLSANTTTSGLWSSITFGSKPHQLCLSTISRCCRESPFPI